MEVAPLCLELLRGEVHLPGVQEDGHREYGVQVDYKEYSSLQNLAMNIKSISTWLLKEAKILLNNTRDQWSPRRFARIALDHDGIQGLP